MALTFAALTPHTPILIPEIGKDHINRLPQTVNAFSKLKDILQASGSESLIIISPHGNVQSDSFTMNLNPEFRADFSDFGNLSLKRSWPGDIALVHRVRERLETTAPLQLTSNEILDHGVSVPLYLLTSENENIKIIPLYYSGLSNGAHFKFGKILRREILVSREKIGVIASGDMSHRLSKDAPAGYSSKGKKFDKKITALLKEKKYDQLLELDDDLISEAGECGLKSILVLCGILDSINHEPHFLSYESPFGVGYLTVNFKL